MHFSQTELDDIVPLTFLAALPRALAEDVLGGCRRVELQPGASLVHSESKPGVAIVVEGLVRVFLKSSGGRQVTVRYARPGETLGLVKLLKRRWEVHAEALTPIVLCALSPRRVHALATRSAPLALAIAEDCAERVADAAEEIGQLAFGSVRQRAARHLLDLASADPLEGDLVAKVSPQALADATGSVREVVARVLKDLHADGVTKRAPRGVTIVDAARLDAEARGEFVASKRKRT